MSYLGYRANDSKKGETTLVFQHMGQSWQQLQNKSILLTRRTVLVICCPDNKETFTYRIDGKIHQVSAQHTESIYLEINSHLELQEYGNSLAIALLLCADVATELDLRQLMPIVSTDKHVSKTAIHTSYIIQKIFTSHSTEQQISRLLYNAQIFEILHHQLRENVQDESRHLSIHYEKVRLAKDIIHKDLSKKITIPELAKIVGTNEQYLKKYFKVYFGKTIASYTTEVKMEYARTLLAGGRHLIVDVSRMTGYKHSTHFTTTFKKYHGFKPMQLK